MIKNPYKVLGVPDGADMDTVTAAYKKLAKKYHPDLNPNDKAAAAKMAEINAAYDQIKNGAAGGAQTDPFTGRRRSGAASGTDYLKSVQSFLMHGQYQQALNLLNNIEDRGARWHYLAAVAYSGLQNRNEAVRHAKTACDMEPNNATYRSAYESLVRGEDVSGEFGGFTGFGGFGFPFGFPFGGFTYTRTGGSAGGNAGGTHRTRRGGCLMSILRFIIILIVLRLIVSLFFGGGLFGTRRYSYNNYGSYPQSSYNQETTTAASDDPGQYFGSNYGGDAYRG